MAKTITKPILCVERCFDGERSLEDAFAEAYALLDNDKLKLFDEMSKLLNYAAKINGATIDVSIDENELVGQIMLTCTDYYIILDADDATRRALVFALEKADTAVIKAIDGKVVIDMTVSLKKYLTN